MNTARGNILTTRILLQRRATKRSNGNQTYDKAASHGSSVTQCTHTRDIDNYKQPCLEQTHTGMYMCLPAPSCKPMQQRRHGKCLIGISAPTTG